MTTQLKTRIAVDLVMTITLVLQMGYMIVGDLPHEIIGTLTIILWTAHNLLHRRWYSSLNRGRYTPIRIVNLVINLLLLLSVAGIAVSAVIMSSYVFSFLGIDRGMSFARGLHMVSVYWTFILSSLHLGLHWSRVVKIIRNSTAVEPSKTRTAVLAAAAVSISCFGVYAFIKQQIASYLFMRTMFVFFDFEQPVASFFLEYIGMLVLFATVAFYAAELVKRKRAAIQN